MSYPTTMRAAQESYDYRAEPDDEDETGLQILIDDICDDMGRAERALKSGDIEAALDILRCAGKSLVEAELQ